MAARRDEVKICGLNAVRMLAERRRRDIVRIHLVESRIADLGPLLKWCAEHKKAYHVVSEAELEKVAESVHHEGVCVLAKAKVLLRFGELLSALKASAGPAALVFLGGVKNPHNVGAILRVAAHFGARAILLPGDEGGGPALGPAIYRTAEGGAESVDLVHVEPLRALHALKGAGFTLYGTSGRAGRTLFRERLAKRSVFLFGAEAEGLSESLEAVCDRSLTIPGTGAVESLNVACAAAVVLGEYWRSARG